jgi:hypothetical protein
MGFGVLLHDSHGQVTAALSEKIAQGVDEHMAKAMSALWVVTFVKELGLSEVWVEGDSSSQITAHQSPSPSLYVGHILDKIRLEASSV